MKNITLFSLILGSVATINCSELVFNTSSGTEYFLEIQPEDSFHHVVNTLQHLENGNGAPQDFYVNLNFKSGRFEAKAKQEKAVPRDYYKPLTSKETESIHYLLDTLAYQSLLKISSKKTALTKSGDQIEDVHPLKFLRYVFSKDELIVCMRNIKERTWLWKDFITRILDSLKTEASFGNITQAQIEDLASTVKMDPNPINSIIQAQDWSGLVDHLIANAPRNDDAKRYDM